MGVRNRLGIEIQDMHFLKRDGNLQKYLNYDYKLLFYNKDLYWSSKFPSQFLPGSWPILSSIAFYGGRKIYHHLIGPLRGKKPSMTIHGLERFLERILSGEALKVEDSAARPKRVILEVDGSSTVSLSNSFFIK